MYDFKIKLITSLPPTYSVIDKLPPFPCYVMAENNSWDMSRNDYTKIFSLFYFDGKIFYNTNIYKQDNSDWITDWRFPTPEERY
jgi:hypothetical protein